MIFQKISRKKGKTIHQSAAFFNLVFLASAAFNASRRPPEPNVPNFFDDDLTILVPSHFGFDGSIIFFSSRVGSYVSPTALLSNAGPNWSAVSPNVICPCRSNLDTIVFFIQVNMCSPQKMLLNTKLYSKHTDQKPFVYRANEHPKSRHINLDHQAVYTQISVVDVTFPVIV